MTYPINYGNSSKSMPCLTEGCNNYGNEANGGFCNACIELQKQAAQAAKEASWRQWDENEWNGEYGDLNHPSCPRFIEIEGP